MKTIITCAVTGAVTSKEQTPYLPVTPEEISESALAAAEEGASIVHLHVRDPETSRPSMKLDLYRETVDKIKKRNNRVLINLTTGAGALYIPSKENLSQGASTSVLLHADKRVEHIEVIKPDLCSIDFNTMHQADGGIRINHKKVTKRMLEIVQSVGTKPELEIFDSGDLRIAKEFVHDETIKGIPFWQFAMGIKYGWEADINTLLYAYNQLPRNSVWSAFGIGKMEMPILSQATIMGGHVRVGLEDNIYVKKGVLAKSNAELVKMAKDIISLLGGEIADPEEAREILSLK
jgi:uncharacterized protein (DUF849 family)